MTQRSGQGLEVSARPSAEDSFSVVQALRPAFSFSLDHLPPSVNEARTPIRGRLVTTSSYRKWMAGAILEIQFKVPMPRRIEGKTPWVAEVRLYGCSRLGDITNRVKAIEDALVKAGVVPDDRWCDDFRVLRMTKRGEHKTVVLISEVE